MLEKVKLALRLTVDDYDSEIQDLIAAALMDLGIAGVITSEDAIVTRAVITYCRIHFGSLPDGEWSRLKASYDEQKAQLMTDTGHTNWVVTT